MDPNPPDPSEGSGRPAGAHDPSYPPTLVDVLQRVAATLGVPNERVTPEAVLTDLVNDSFRLVELAIEVQEDFNVIFTQSDLKAVRTIADLATLIAARR